MPILEKTLGKITVEPRIASVPVVLSDFERIEVTPPVQQDELKAIQAHFMTLAQCAAGQVEDAAEREQISKNVHDRMARYGTSSEYIAQRQVSVLTSRFVKPDPTNASESIRRYGDLRLPTGELLDARMRLFEEVACDVFERVYRDSSAAAPDDIVHVSCSGYLSPSPVQSFLSRRGWLNVGVTHSYHMGCYGAFPAIRTAVGLVGSSYASLPKRKQRVDLVHTEFLSLHFDLLGDEPDNFVTSTLFADGFIKYAAYPQAEFAKHAPQRSQGAGDRRAHSSRLAARNDAAPGSAAVRHVALEARAVHDPRFDRRLRRLDLRAGRSGFRTREVADGLRDSPRRPGDSQSNPQQAGHRGVADRIQPPRSPRSRQYGFRHGPAHLAAHRGFARDPRRHEEF